MAKIFRPSNRESSILSKIESSKEYAKKRAINSVKECIEPLSNAIAMKLIENDIIETTNKNALEEQINKCLEKLSHSDEFDIDYQIAPVRNIIPNPHIVSIYVTSFVIEKLINHKDVIDIFGSDEDIYHCINQQVIKFLP
ncbi:MAG: hypothetical protein LWX02_11090 [Deltaproteobacteria bacterium]|jgi:ribosomal protein L17|nr:hypothetical protein [Deltaproteobacteria bacterium]MDL1988571.1 hypothetical protein [Deltaproteobacteria bacterium]